MTTASSTGRAEARALLFSVAFVWIATGASVLSPTYREIGRHYLAPLGLPDAAMFAACALEVVLGLWVAARPPSTWVTALQIALITGFTTALAWLDPLLLAHPFGVLSKNLPLVAVLLTAWLQAREGWTARALWVLRAGMAVIWITEGLFPKVFFQQGLELGVVAGSGLVPVDPSVFLVVLGVAQAVSGVSALLLCGRPLRWLLLGQAAALVVLPILVSVQLPFLWVHPFGPMIKNVPLIVGTLVVVRRCSSPS